MHWCPLQPREYAWRRLYAHGWSCRPHSEQSRVPPREQWEAAQNTEKGYMQLRVRPPVSNAGLMQAGCWLDLAQLGDTKPPLEEAPCFQPAHTAEAGHLQRHSRIKHEHTSTVAICVGGQSASWGDCGLQSMSKHRIFLRAVPLNIIPPSCSPKLSKPRCHRPLSKLHTWHDRAIFCIALRAVAVRLASQ